MASDDGWMGHKAGAREVVPAALSFIALRLGLTRCGDADPCNKIVSLLLVVIAVAVQGRRVVYMEVLFALNSARDKEVWQLRVGVLRLE
jgi:hypothetical protein